MKKNIRPAWLLLMAGILVNFSLFTRATPQTTGWNIDDPNGQPCLTRQEIPVIESEQVEVNQVKIATSQLPLQHINCEESDVIEAIKTPNNVTEVYIDPTSDQIIQCPQGSILHLDANSLVNKKGEVLNEPVTIRVKECYKLRDILANKLQTTCNGKIIETAGMLEITALAGTDTLQLASEEDVDIAMPAGAGNGYELFNGAIDENGAMNWILDENNPVRMAYLEARSMPDIKAAKPGVPLESEVKKLFQTDTTCKFGITHFILEESAGTYEMHAFNFIDASGNRLGDFLTSQFKPDKKTISNACASNQNCSVSLNIDAQGRLKHPTIEGALTSTSKKSLLSVLKNLPTLNRNFFDPITNGRERLKIIMGNLNRRNTKPEKLKTSDSSNETWASVRANWVMDESYKKRLSYYVTSSMKLGWINCDRFARMEPSTLCTINLEIENKQVDEVMIVFETTQSAMALYKKEDGSFVSQPLPPNTNLKVVCMINDDKNPKIYTYGILSGRNKKFVVRENQKKGERDPGEEINTPA